MRQSAEPVFAWLAKDGGRVLCGLNDCGYRIGDRVEHGGHNYLVLGLAYRVGEDGTWRGPRNKARAALQRGTGGLRRVVPNRIDPPCLPATNHIPRRLPAEVSCSRCGTLQMADPDRLGVEAICGDGVWKELTAWVIIQHLNGRPLRHTVRLWDVRRSAVEGPRSPETLAAFGLTPAMVDEAAMGNDAPITPHPFVMFAQYLAATRHGADESSSIAS